MTPPIWPPPPKGMEPVEPESRFKAAPVHWAIGWLAANIGFSVIVSGIELALASNLRSPSLLASNAVWSLLQSATGIGVLVSFLVWFYRAYKNLYAFNTVGLRYTAGWAVAWFFVPALSLARPYQCAQVIWKASAPEVDNSDFGSWNSAPGGTIIRAWWFLTLVSGVAALLPLLALFQEHGILTQSDYTTSAIADLLVAAANTTTIFLIRSVSARQLAKASSEASGFRA